MAKTLLGVRPQTQRAMHSNNMEARCNVQQQYGDQVQCTATKWRQNTMHSNNMMTDLGRRDARVVESDHVVSGDACCRQCLEQQVCTEVLGSTHQQTRSLHRAVHLPHAQQHLIKTGAGMAQWLQVLKSRIPAGTLTVHSVGCC